MTMKGGGVDLVWFLESGVQPAPTVTIQHNRKKGMEVLAADFQWATENSPISINFTIQT